MKNNQAMTIYAEALVALERGASFDEIQPLLASLAGIDCIDCCTDDFGLTISMRAAALGRLDVVKAAHALGASLELCNKLTNANLLHYVAQQPEGGADIIKWVILDQKASDALLNQQILLPGKDRREEDKNWDRGNGHTVAFEAVFNDNVGVIEALIKIKNQGHKVDFTTPAVHGRSPLGWALKRNANAIVELLGKELHPDLTSLDVWKEDSATRKEYAEKEDSATMEYAKKKDEEWRSSPIHSQDHRALDLAQELRRYIVDGPTQKQWVKNLLNQFNDVEPNKPYGRFGQPLLILVPTHPDIMNLDWNDDRRDRYTDVVQMLINDRNAGPRTPEKGLMEVNAGFREVFFGPMGALEIIIQGVDPSARAAFLNTVGLFNGYTRLIDAALIGRKEAIELLLKYDPNRRIKGFNGWTACAAAEIYNNKVNVEKRIPKEVLTHLCDDQERRGLPKENGEITDATDYPPARLQFFSDWRVIQQGEIGPGGKLIVDYDTGRLPNFRKTWREADIWNIEIYIRFHPSGQLHRESLLKEVRYGDNGPVIDHIPKPLEIGVPLDATQVELWFRTFDNVGGFWEAWDSQFGQNYWFDVARVGDATKR